MRRLVLYLLGAACLVFPVFACGTDEGIGEQASLALSPHVQTVRAEATAGDRDGALAALAELRQEVGQLRAAGELNERGASTVLEAAVDVERQVMLLPAPARPVAEEGGRSVTTSSGKDEDQKKVDEEARKRAEEAAKKAEEEAKKRAEEAKKRAEEGKKD